MGGQSIKSFKICIVCKILFNYFWFQKTFHDSAFFFPGKIHEFLFPNKFKNFYSKILAAAINFSKSTQYNNEKKFFPSASQRVLVGNKLNKFS